VETFYTIFHLMFEILFQYQEHQNSIKLDAKKRNFAYRAVIAVMDLITTMGPKGYLFVITEALAAVWF
jgi:hypothetical protein